MIRTIELPISVTSEQNLAQQLFDQHQHLNAEHEQSGLGIKLVSQSKGYGAIDPSFVLGLVLSFPVGVASGVVANWVYHKLSQQGRNLVRIGDAKEPLVTKVEITLHIENLILQQERSSSDTRPQQTEGVEETPREG